MLSLFVPAGEKRRRMSGVVASSGSGHKTDVRPGETEAGADAGAGVRRSEPAPSNDGHARYAAAAEAVPPLGNLEVCSADEENEFILPGDPDFDRRGQNWPLSTGTAAKTVKAKCGKRKQGNESSATAALADEDQDELEDGHADEPRARHSPEEKPEKSREAATRLSLALQDAGVL